MSNEAAQAQAKAQAQADVLTFLRHPKPEVAPGLCYGQLDIPLSAQAEGEIAEALRASPKASVILTSPAQRCMRLAEALAARDGIRIIQDSRLKELSFGKWEGLTWDQIDRAESDPWAEDPWNIAPPEGETFAALTARVREVLEEILEEVLETAPEGATIVCHAGVIRAAQMILLGEVFDDVFARLVPYATPISMKRP